MVFRRRKKIRYAGKIEQWRVNLYTLWFTQICSMIGFNITIPFVAYFFQDLGVTNGAELNNLVGLSSTFPSLTMAIFSPIWGAVSDRYGRKMMLQRAMLFAAITLFAMGFSRSVAFFLVLRLVQGIFTGTITASMAFVSANTPENRMSYALGFMTSSNFLGYAIGPILGGFLVDYIGYKGCFLSGSLVMLIGLAVVTLVVKEDPKSYGPELVRRRKEAREQGESTSILTRFVVSTLVLLLIVRMARTVFSPYIALYVQDRLGSMEGASRYTGMINGAAGVATAISAMTLTRLGDKHDKFKMAFIFSGITLLTSLLLSRPWPLGVFALSYGLFYFFAGAVEPFITSAVSEKVDTSQRGQLFGLTGMINSAANIISPMIGAAVANRFSIVAILYLIPLMTLVQMLVIRLSRPGSEKRGRKGK